MQINWIVGLPSHLTGPVNGPAGSYADRPSGGDADRLDCGVALLFPARGTVRQEGSLTALRAGMQINWIVGLPSHLTGPVNGPAGSFADRPSGGDADILDFGFALLFPDR